MSNNLALRELFQKESEFPLFWPPNGLSLDNGAMIAALGFFDFLKRGRDSLDLDPLPKIPFKEINHETFSHSRSGSYASILSK